MWTEEGKQSMDSKGEDFIIKQTKILAGIGLGLSAVVVIAVLLLAISVQNTLKSTDEQEQSGWRWSEDSQGGLVGNFYDDGNLIRWVEYKYDATGNLVEFMLRDWADDISVRREHEYDEAGNMIKETIHCADGDVQYEYDTAGNKVKEIKYRQDGSVRYEYDAAGHTLKEVSYSKEGKIEDRYEYEYSAAGNLVKKTYSYHNDLFYEYEYDEAGNEVKSMSYDADGYVFSWYEYEYDAVGNKVKEIHYDGLYKERHQYEYQYSETIIECADGIQTHVISDISYEQKKAWYEFAVNENEVYHAVLECEEGTDAMQYHFCISHEDDEIQNINWTNWDGFYQPGYPSFLDANMDGYMDMMVAVYSYPSFDVHELYIWNPEEQCFEKVIYDGILANIEVREDSVRNWIRNGTGYILETLQWKGNELILASTEEVLPED